MMCRPAFDDDDVPCRSASSRERGERRERRTTWQPPMGPHRVGQWASQSLCRTHEQPSAVPSGGGDKSHLGSVNKGGEADRPSQSGSHGFIVDRQVILYKFLTKNLTQIFSFSFLSHAHKTHE